MMQEDGFLDERHDVAGVGDFGTGLPGPPDQLIAQLAGQPLRLTPGRASAGSPRLGDRPAARSSRRHAVCPRKASAPPGAAGACPAPAGYLIPLAVPVPELKVRPCPEGSVPGQQVPDK